MTTNASAAYIIDGPYPITPSGNPSGQSGYSVQFGASEVGSSFEINWFLPSGSISNTGTVLPDDLSASASFTLDAFDAASRTIDMTVDISNLTDTGIFSKAAILSFGFGVDPDVSGGHLIDSGTIFDGFNPDFTNPSLPAISIGTCIFAANNCAGGNINQGLQIGVSDTLSFQLLFGNGSTLGTLDAVTFAPFGLKFQTNKDSWELSGTPDSGTQDCGNPAYVITHPECTSANPVPEPSIIWLFVSGFASVLGYSHRRSKNT
ncbi:MAG: cistern family PEP-CTERM protein [Gammaproteobacteria bacterium]